MFVTIFSFELTCALVQLLTFVICCFACLYLWHTGRAHLCLCWLCLFCLSVCPMHLQEKSADDYCAHASILGSARFPVNHNGAQEHATLGQMYTAHCVLCIVYFSAQPNKLRPILKIKEYYPEHIFVPACSSARKAHFFKF